MMTMVKQWSALKANQGVALTTDNGLLAGIAQEILVCIS